MCSEDIKDEDEDIKDSSNATFILILIILIIVILLSPILIAIFVTNNWELTGILSKAAGDSNVWIGFWGSYLGGALGTIGVIFVAHLQNKEQRKSMKIIEQDNMKRLKIQTLLELANNYNKDLYEFHSKLTNIQNKIKNIAELSLEAESSSRKRGTDAINRDIDVNRNHLINMDVPAGFVLNTFGNIQHQNITLSSQNFFLEEPLLGKQSLYYDKVIAFLTSSNYANDKFLKLLTETQRDEDKDFEEISKWLLSEKTKLSVASAFLLHDLK